MSAALCTLITPLSPGLEMHKKHQKRKQADAFSLYPKKKALPTSLFSI
jgi:hypothetical protein